MNEARELWTVILAGGEGSRFAPLARSLYGANLPKQYATVVGSRSMLQETIDRMSGLVPAGRTIVVTQTAHLKVVRAQLRPWPDVHVLAQPSNRGTAAAVLLALAHLGIRAPGAHLVLTPSDHHVPRPGPFLEAVTIATLAADRVPATLLGVSPESPETQYGWIVPGRELIGALRTVERFVEKPSLSLGRRLLAEGALWNTMVTVGAVSDLWALVARHLPVQAAQIAALVRDAPDDDDLATCYREMAPANFSRDVLEAARGLAVLSVEGSGWCDWGWPEQVFKALRGRTELDALMLRSRLRQSERAVG